jgi:hypothetical protein
MLSSKDSTRPEGKCEGRGGRILHVILRTVLGDICNRAALSGPRRQPVNVAFHPGESDR